MIKTIKYSVRITRNDGTTTLTVLPKYIVRVNSTTATSFADATEFHTGVADPLVSQIVFTKVNQAVNPGLYAFLQREADWRTNKIEVFYSVNNGASFMRLYEGLLFVRSEELNTVTFTVRGYLDLLNITLVETPVLRNRKTATYIPSAPVGASNATLVSLLQKQNPTIAAGSRVGIINALLWLLGGRPFKYKKLFDDQHSSVAGTYPKFYYDCQSSIINPEWVWFNYENLREDLNMLCKASGGNLRQRTDGLVEYVNIYNFNKSTPDITLTDSTFESLALSEMGTEPYSRIVTQFTPRYLAGSQKVYNMVFDEYLGNGQLVTRRVDFDKPVWKLVNKTVSGQLTDTIVSSGLKNVKDNITAVDLFGTRRVVNARIKPHETLYIPKYVSAGTPGNFISVRDQGVVSSQSTSLVIRNNLLSDASSLYIGEVSLFGRALEAANAEVYIEEINQFTTIEGFKELRIQDNPYIQNNGTARRFSAITKYLMENPRQKLAIQGVPTASGVSLGTIVRVVSTYYNLDDNYEVTGISFNETLNQMNLNVISTSGLYTDLDLFIVGNQYTSPDLKYLAF
jgi:hypothetical protein